MEWNEHTNSSPSTVSSESIEHTINKKKSKANHKKRRFDEFNAHSHSNSNQRNKKKRKRIDTAVDMLVRSNKLLRTKYGDAMQENNDLKHANNELSKENRDLKQALIAHKQEIKELQAQFHTNKAESTKIQNNTNANTDLNSFFDSIQQNGYVTNFNTDINYDSVVTRLLAMGYDKTEVRNSVALYKGSGKSTDFVFDQLLNVFTANIANILQTIESIPFPQTQLSIPCHISDSKAKKVMDIDLSSFININQTLSKPLPKKKRLKLKECNTKPKKESMEYKQRNFESCYYVSVPCHLCDELFSDIYAYRTHLKGHYTTDPSKTYLVCDLGCDGRRKFSSSEHFSSHISSHTKDRPYHCNIVTNGVQCTHTTGLKYDMKRHWQRHFKIDQKTQKMRMRSVSNRTPKKQRQKTVTDSSDTDHSFVEFEEGEAYKVSVHCHICGEYFDDITEFREHLQVHYEADSDMQWRVCDFGCDREKFPDSKTFISHIISHTQEKPYYCNVSVEGKKCFFAVGTKGGMRYHWRKHFESMNIDFANIGANKDKVFQKFEDCFLVSVHCHVCGIHFDNVCEYTQHLEVHYIQGKDMEWKVCNFGCDRPKFKCGSEFIKHIAMHTGEKPYECTVSVDGVRCMVSMVCKSNMKVHWKKHLFEKKFNKKIYDKFYKKNSRDQKTNISSGSGKIKTGGVVEFLDSYHIAVNCHICGEMFRDIDEYCTHLENHYSIDSTKTWLQCDFGCETKERFNKKEFVSHISQHTKNSPFKCDTVINGVSCKASFGEMENLTNHWKTHYPKQTKVKTTVINAAKPKRKPKRKKRPYPFVEDPEFVKSYIVSVHCHICGQFFDDIHLYRNHLREHYRKDKSKEWMKCEFGCGEVNYQFVCHIASHTKNYPFQCNVVENGKKCPFTAGTKSNTKAHWNKRHNPKYIRAKLEKKSTEKRLMIQKSAEISESESERESDCSLSSSCESGSDSDSAIESDMAFQKSFYISINCHVCDKHFNDDSEYKKHLKAHYSNDSDKEWMKCDFGCLNEEGRPKRFHHFVGHISTHTSEYVFKCSVKKCGHMCSDKSNLRRHWRSFHNKEVCKKREESSDSSMDSDVSSSLHKSYRKIRKH